MGLCDFPLSWHVALGTKGAFVCVASGFLAVLPCNVSFQGWKVKLQKCKLCTSSCTSFEDRVKGLRK